MSRFNFLTTYDIETAHRTIMTMDGWAGCLLLHPDKLDGAVHKAEQRAYYDPDADLIDLAAVLVAGVSQAQAFEKGNKRAAIASLSLFLKANGFQLVGSREDVACWIICIAGHINVDETEFVVERFGFDRACELDGATRDEVILWFGDWLADHVEAIE